MSRTLIETGTPEELVEQLAKRAPSLEKGRYRLVVQPESDAQGIVDQLDALFREMDSIPDPETARMTDDEVTEYADRIIGEIRASESARRSA